MPKRADLIDPRTLQTRRPLAAVRLALWRSTWTAEGDRLWRLSGHARQFVRANMAIRDAALEMSACGRMIGKVLAPVFRDLAKAFRGLDA